MDDVLSFLQDFDVANFLPEPKEFVSDLAWWIRILVLLGPLILVALGALYYFAPPKEANHSFGFRTYWGMGSVQAWLFAQKVAGLGYMIVGGAMTLLMGIVSIFFRGDSAMAAINIAMVCVIIELVVTVLLWVALNLLILRAFDKEGNRRV